MLTLIFPSRTTARVDIPIEADYIEFYPESAMHPQDQLKYADQLLWRAGFRRKKIAVVTYSELILYRVQTRIAGYPPLRNFVRIFIWEPKDNSLIELEIDNTGGIVNAPEGWLEEGYQETIRRARYIEQNSFKAMMKTLLDILINNMMSQKLSQQVNKSPR